MAKLAINGGAPAVTLPQKEALRWPVTDDPKTLKAVEDLTRRGELSFSEYSDKLEEEFRKLSGCKYAIAMNSGTAAAHAAFFALGIEPGDEVICPTFTYWASIMPAVLMGARPVFCEMVPETLCADPADIAKRITKRTKAIVVVHMVGMPCEMTEIMRIARKHGIKVIEDCAHAHGALYRGKPVGSYGDASFFSMQSSKLMVAGEGGVFVTNKRDYYRRATFLGHYERLKSHNAFPQYNGVCGGMKYRIHPLAAAIGYHQALKLPKMNERRNKNLRRLLDAARGLQTWNIAPEPKYVDRVYYQAWYSCNMDALKGIGKQRFLDALRAEGCRVNHSRYSMLHQNPIFQDAKVWASGGLFPAFVGQKAPLYGVDDFPVTAAARESLIWMPTFPHAGTALVDQYIKAFKKVDANLDELRK